MNTANSVVCQLASFAAKLEEDMGCSVWHERVSSSVNIADLPSRDPTWNFSGAILVSVNPRAVLQDSLGLYAVTPDSGGGGAM